jgi:hypothetical protein
MELLSWTYLEYILVSHMIQMDHWSYIFLVTSNRYADSIFESNGILKNNW